MLVAGLLLGLAGLGMLLLLPVQHLGSYGKSEIRAYMDADANKQQATTLAKTIEKWPAVRSATLLDRELAWKEYSSHSGVPADTLPENPLPQVLIIGVYNDKFIAGVSTRLQALGAFSLLLSNPPWAENAHRIGTMVSAFLLLIIFAVVKVFRDTIILGIFRSGQTPGRARILGAGVWLGFISGVFGCLTTLLAVNIWGDIAGHEVRSRSMIFADFGYILLFSCILGLIAAAITPARVHKD